MSGPWTPQKDDLVVDTRSDRPARVMDIRRGRLFLRPPAGGREWEAMPAHVRAATGEEVLSARVAAENAASRAGAA